MLGPNNAVLDDGEWVSWHEINRQLQYKEWGTKFPNADRALIPIFEDLLSLAQAYYLQTGLHLQVYGDIGELFSAVTHGVRLHRNYAQGSDGRLGDDFIEVKTITPFKTRDFVTISSTGNFSKLFVVKINDVFEIAGKMVERSALKWRGKTEIRVYWDQL